MGSDDSHFNVSLIVRDKVTRQCPQTTIFLKRKESCNRESNRGLSAYQPTRLTARPNRLTPLVGFRFQCCFTSTETIRLIGDGEARTATSTFTQPLSSDVESSSSVSDYVHTVRDGEPRTAT